MTVNSCSRTIYPSTKEQKKGFRNGFRSTRTSCGVDLDFESNRSQSSWTSVGCAGQTSLIHRDSSSELTGLKGSPANIMVPNTRAHLQESSGVHASGSGLFWEQVGTIMILFGYAYVNICIMVMPCADTITLTLSFRFKIWRFLIDS